MVGRWNILLKWSLFRGHLNFWGCSCWCFSTSLQPFREKGLEALSLSRKSMFDKMIFWHSNNACSLQKRWVIFKVRFFEGTIPKMKITSKCLPWIITIKTRQDFITVQWDLEKNCGTCNLKITAANHQNVTLITPNVAWKSFKMIIQGWLDS